MANMGRLCLASGWNRSLQVQQDHTASPARVDLDIVGTENYGLNMQGLWVQLLLLYFTLCYLFLSVIRMLVLMWIPMNICRILAIRKPVFVPPGSYSGNQRWLYNQEVWFQSVLLLFCSFLLRVWAIDKQCWLRTTEKFRILVQA